MTSRITAPGHRWRWLSIVAVANLAAVGLVAAPSQARGVSLCSGTAENFTIAGDLAVPAGASCTLINSQVNGDVEVRTEANLLLEGSTIRGDVTVRDNGFIDSIESSIRGETRLRDAFGGVVEASELRRDVSVRGAGFLISDGSTHRGDISSRAGQTIVLSSRISGDLSTDGDLVTDVRDSVITGRLTVEAPQLGSVICRSEIDRDAEVQASGDLIQLGDGVFAGCEFNVFGDDLVIRDNLGEIQINGNVIRDDLDCTGNAIAPTGAGNRIRGEALGQCAGLGAAAAPALGLSGATTESDRLTGALDQAADRAAAARAAAELAGPADL